MMKYGELVVLLLFIAASAVFAQVATPVLPTSADVLVIPALGDPTTVAPIAVRNTPVSAALCNQAALPAGPLSPLINPATVEVDDPFTVGRKCRLAMPVGLPNGAGYRAVAVFNGLCGTSPCSSSRSLVGIPPFDIVGIQASPAVPTTPAVRP